MSCCAPGAEFDASQAAIPSDEELLLASRSLGNGDRQIELSVPAVHCAACIQTIEGALGRLPGVEAARVNLSTKRVSVKWHDGALPPITATLTRLGYAPNLFDEAMAGKDGTLSELIRAVAVSGFAAGNIMLLSVSVWSGAEGATRDLFHWVSALIALPALFFAGRIYYRSAWSALRYGRMNMDVPIAIGVTLAYAMSLYETINHGHYAYFDASVTLLFFLLIGRTLDHVMRDRAREAVIGLARLAPRGALVISDDGVRDYRPVEEIRPGQRLLVAAGERIPVDARVIDGRSDLDRSLVTGESAPAQTGPGAAVQAGTLNLTGPLTLEATAAASGSFLAEMIRMLEAAEGGRARYRRIAERVSALYAPVVHLTAFATFLGWMAYGGDWHQALTIAIAVLIITCPCALGLAVPIVQVVAARRLFEAGVMVKDGSGMERLAEADTVVFDKTGTLTLGRPRLVGTETIAPALLATAAALAAHSRHPLSQAIASEGLAVIPPPLPLPTRGREAPTSAIPHDWKRGAAAWSPSPLWGGGGVGVDAICDWPSRQPNFSNVTELPGLGVEGRAGGHVWRLGRAAWAADAPGDGTVLSRDGKAVAEFAFEDRLRPGAPDAVAAVAAGIGPVEMLSGDGEAACARVASALGIESFRSGMLPADKVARLTALAQDGHKVLMVGDGLNDAPALGAAHVSMAPASAADVGRNAADFVFLRDGLEAVPVARDVAVRAGRLIRQNIAIAILYNAFAVPIAILGYVTPLIAAVAMSASSIIVIANALRLAPLPRRKARQEVGSDLVIRATRPA
ncbi:cation-translocating P-type ATPase [Mesorhizobium sp. J428]|uniref:cation-translocating P-type ATPase n=1 Tax=Mesorhizobium sp. J428 TaxID=2898440 RepID=UPI0021506EE1|nr:cation-translocating P-type ATPase [Mesorhizobium sp. J428]MCR5858151.1 cation-translocating P-type ATPase [Mesorhizobium sp. J428]